MLPAALEAEDLQLSAAPADGGCAVTLRGTLVFAENYWLADSWFDRLHECLRAEAARSVTVDLRPLGFVSSSGIRLLIDWIGRIRNDEAERQYSLVLVLDPEVEWQERSARALHVLGRGIVKLSP